MKGLRGRLVFHVRNAKWVFAELGFWKKKEKEWIFSGVGLGAPWKRLLGIVCSFRGF